MALYKLHAAARLPSQLTPIHSHGYTYDQFVYSVHSTYNNLQFH